jgi:hypothetical protein
MTFLQSCYKGYYLIGAKLTAKEICGEQFENYCSPGSYGTVLPMKKNPYKPGVKLGYTADSIAIKIVGNCITDFTGSNYITCSFTSANPFSNKEIEPKGSIGGTTLNYSRKESFKIDVDVAAKATMSDIAKFTNQELLKQIEVKVRTAYNNISASSLEVRATYYEFGLTEDVLNKLRKNDGYVECKKYCVKKNYNLITAIGLIAYSVDFNKNSIQTFTSDLEATLKSNSIPVDISISFKKEIQLQHTSKTSTAFQVIGWRFISPQQLNSLL